MIKRYQYRWLILLVGVVGVLATLIWSRARQRKNICTSINIKFDASPSERFVSSEAIADYLRNQGVEFIGKPVNEINLSVAEFKLAQQPFVRKVDCYVDLNSKFTIEIEQRKPILRVFPKYGKPYYLDEDGGTFPMSKLFSANVPIASGDITPSLNTKLYTIGNHVHQSEFLKAFIEHIFVRDDGEFVCTTQIAGHQVVIGDETNLSDKFAKLELFYDRALKNLGWETYKEINLSYKDQVIGRK